MAVMMGGRLAGDTMIWLKIERPEPVVYMDKSTVPSLHLPPLAVPLRALLCLHLTCRAFTSRAVPPRAMP